MYLLIDLGIVILCIISLWVGATWLVGSATRIARHTGLSELVIGLTIVAFGTSAPELAVTINSALNGYADISVGNVVGSNIFNLGFILGGVALISAVSISRPLVYRDGAVLFGASIVLVIFMRDLTLARWEGMVLFGLLVVYLSYLLLSGEELTDEIPEGDFSPWDVGQLIVGLVLVVGGGRFLVDAASDIARLVGLSEWVIGVTIVAAGTSAPEMATSFAAAFRGQHGLSVGSLIGSDIFNLLGVLGVAGMIQPLQVDPTAIGSVWMMSAMVLTVLVLLRTRWVLSRAEGGLLLFISIARWALDFMR